MYDEGQNARERARSHSARAAILALLAKGNRELSAPEIRAELPGGLTLRNIYYHLGILETTHLVVKDGDNYKLS